MATTLETFAGARRGNYCTLPTIDVEILPDIHHCQTCGETVIYQQHRWLHGNHLTPDHGWIAPKVMCRYCHSEDAVYHQHAYHDAIECNRCGGVDGYAIGD